MAGQNDSGFSPWLIALGALLGVALVWGVVTSRDPGEVDPSPATTSPSSQVSADTPAAAPAPLEVGDLDLDAPPIASSETAVVFANQLPSDRPARFAVQLGEASTDTAPRPVRLVSTDQRLLEIEAPIVGSDRLHASIEVEPGFLAPGRYLVEVKTTEKSHFPLRRYVIDVR